MGYMARKPAKNISFDPDLFRLMNEYVAARKGRWGASDVVNAGLLAFFRLENSGRDVLINDATNVDREVDKLPAVAAPGSSLPPIRPTMTRDRKAKARRNGGAV